MKAFTYQTYIITFTVLVLSSCTTQPELGSNPETKTAEDQTISIFQKQFEAGGMKLGKLTSRPFATSISTRGHIDVPPASRAAVSPYYGGYVNKIDVLPGQKVKKGELLFTLQNPDYLKLQQAYLEAKEQLDYLKLDFERQQTLADEQISSQKNFKKAESDYRVMKAKQEGLREQLKLMDIALVPLEQGKLISIIAIYAPIEGTISKVNITKSAYVNASEVALEIVNTEHIHLELQVFEKDAIRVKEHQRIIFSVPESTSQVFSGEVHLVGKSVDAQQRTVDIHGHIAEIAEGQFIPGMYVEAEIEVSSDTAWCLPNSAVFEKDGSNFVLVQTSAENEKSQFRLQPVSTLREVDDWVEISSTNDIKDLTLLIEGANDYY
jgi:cobalt-zinc-cadmium efflux system membrane fusion protein